jgi:hypothetical protein
MLLQLLADIPAGQHIARVTSVCADGTRSVMMPLQTTA